MGNPGRGIRLRSSGRTDTGRVRDNNEDSVHVWSSDDQLVLAIVADGMGGAVAGEQASRIAVESITTRLVDQHGNQLFESVDLVSNLRDTIHDANLNIIDHAKANPELKGMGTTVTLAVAQAQQVIVGHVGDSRAYRIRARDETIEQITYDHSFVQALVEAGHITSEEAEDHPMRNVLYRALGQTPDIEVDIYYEQLDPDDRIVLCSDGLTLHVQPAEIAEITLQHENPAVASQQMIDLANERGGRDNISVIVIKLEGDEAEQEILSEDSQQFDLSGAEASSEATIPGEKSNLGASEAPAITHRDTQEIDPI